MTDEEDSKASVGRRELLIGVPVAGAALAGCYAVLRLGDDASDESTDGDDGTPTPGYGGVSPTVVAGAAGAATPDLSTGDGDTSATGATETETSDSTATPAETPTATETSTPTETPSPDNYGEYTYGQDDYGGVDP